MHYRKIFQDYYFRYQKYDFPVKFVNDINQYDMK
jgi:hypothetical protein